MMRNIFLLLLITLTIAGCKKDNTPPTLELKSGGSYTSGDLVAAPGTQITVGVNAYQVNDELNLFYVESAFDGANTNMLVSKTWLTGEERKQYSKDITITLRSAPGTERWIFNVNDSDGRISKKEIRITVQ